MHQVKPLALEELAAAKLTIVHQQTGDVQPFILSEEQRIAVRAISDHRRVIILKGRQVYVSTACCAYALLFAAVNPSVKVAIVADTREKAEGLLAKVASWAREASFRITAANTRRLVLWNKAEVHAVTANSTDAGSAEVKAGRSFSYGLIVLSEFAYYMRDAALLASLTRSALAGAHIVIESTATPAENQFQGIWNNGEGWHKVFLSFEQHAAYQLDPQAISDETWDELRETYGFKSRPHAAYWHRMVMTDMNGDIHRGLREAPILPQHAFAFAEGRWIFAFDERAPVSVDGAWRHYEEPDDSGAILGVDTASGVGKDSSAIAVIGRRHGNLLATFRDDTVSVPDFITAIKAAVMRYQPAATVIESNGIGAGVYQAIGQVPQAHVWEHSSHDSEKPIRMALTKAAIESGQVQAGPELVREIEHSVQLRPRTGKGAAIWDGPDDLLNAIGFALAWRRDNPWRAAAPRINSRTHVDRTAWRRQKRKTGL